MQELACQTKYFDLMAESFSVLLSSSPTLRIIKHQGYTCFLTHEPTPDLNYILVNEISQDGENLELTLQALLAKKQPILVMVLPQAFEQADPIVRNFAPASSADIPYMIHHDPIQPQHNLNVEIFLAKTERHSEMNAEVLTHAFDTPYESILRTMPASFFNQPNVTTYIATLADVPIACVTLTWHGNDVGVCALGVKPPHCKFGTASQLLSTAMHNAQQNEGAKQFFLASTPLAYNIYLKLGYQPIFTSKIYAFGPTYQT